MITNNSLKSIKSNIKTNNPKLKESAYKTHVRPLGEHVASVWDPWQKKIHEQNRNDPTQGHKYKFNDYSFTSRVSSKLS